MMNYTKTQEMAINNYLAVCIKNNYRCQHCAKNDNGICFFAFQCFANDMMHFDDEEDEPDIPDDVDDRFPPDIIIDDIQKGDAVDARRKKLFRIDLNNHPARCLTES